jgi:hypothetical protein
VIDQDLSYCLNGGLVVGGEYDLPSDFHVHRKTSNDIIGCNRLWCSSCRVLVKSIRGFNLTGGGRDKPIDHVKLYESEDPADWEPYVARGDQFRTYFCKCSFVSWAGFRDARYLDSYSIDTWRCAGHPDQPVASA